MAAENEDTKTGQSPKVTAKPAKAQTPQKTPEGQNNPPPAGGAQPKGNVDPNDRSGEKGVVKIPTPGVTGTILNVTLNDAARNADVQIGGRAVPRAGAGRPGDPWGTRAALDEKRARQHEINMANQAAERERIRKIGEEATAKYKARQEKRQAAIESGDFTDLTTISQDTWNKLGQRTGTVEKYDKNDDGSLKPDGKGGYLKKVYEGEGSMYDVTKGADAIGKLEKWWAEEGVATSSKAIPKGVFDENGKLKTDGLTADQFGALQKIMENSQAKLAPIRQRVELNNAQNYLNASEYLSKKGVKVWDTATGQRLLSKDQVMKMAREMQIGDAKEALKGMNGAWKKATEIPVDSEGNPFTDKKDIEFYQQRDFQDSQKREAALVAQMRRLGFRADQIADDSGNIDYTRMAKALSGVSQEPVPTTETTQKAAPKATAKAGAKQPPAAAPKPTRDEFAEQQFADIMKGVDEMVNAPMTRTEPIRQEAAPAPAQASASQTAPEKAELSEFARQVLLGPAYQPKPAVDPLSFEGTFGYKPQPDDGSPKLVAGRPLTTESGTIRARGAAPVDPMFQMLNTRGGFNRQGAEAVTAMAAPLLYGGTKMLAGTGQAVTGDTEAGVRNLIEGGLAAVGGTIARNVGGAAKPRVAPPQSPYAGGVMPGSGSTVQSTARRLAARAEPGEGVISPRRYGTPLGREEAARVEAGYARGAKMERQVQAAKAREAAAAAEKKAARLEKAKQRRVEKKIEAAKARNKASREAEAKDLKDMNRALKSKAKRAEKKYARERRDRRIRENEAKIPAYSKAKQRRHN